MSIIGLTKSLNMLFPFKKHFWGQVFLAQMINLNFIMNLKESGNLIDFLKEVNVLKRIIYCSGCSNPLRTVKI